MSTIRVEIAFSQFWDIAKHQPVHMNVSVIKRLKDYGLPVDGDIGLRGVTHGRLVCFDEIMDGDRFCVYEWTPGADSPRQPVDLSDL